MKVIYQFDEEEKDRIDVFLNAEKMFDALNSISNTILLFREDPDLSKIETIEIIENYLEGFDLDGRD